MAGRRVQNVHLLVCAQDAHHMGPGQQPGPHLRPSRLRKQVGRGAVGTATPLPAHCLLQVAVRVLFPDRYILQGFFRPNETGKCEGSGGATRGRAWGGTLT